ncbi:MULTISPECIES: hypothetical protein [Vibrio]|uniref:hypothetical protein n=1 Tax=Vibrio TaxID=662 RepID=UPI0010BDE08B|nr:hypothetical protein [Vibrio sp. F12]TKE87548.1 hypothetical protein FCV54_01390 [Vibrio sp. F12]CAK3815776.1 MSHA biogenesis protein MshK [Vibrio crassostreae]
MKVIFLLIITLFSVHSYATTLSVDSGKVERIFASTEGSIAVSINGGFPQANADKQCPGNNGWAGINVSDGVIKSTIIAAKASGQTLTVVTGGCEDSWLKIKHLYLE